MLEYLGRPDRRLDGVDELAGLGRTRPLAAAMLAVFMFSLAGVPPMAGFWGKLLLFGSALNVDGTAGGSLRWWFIGLAIVGVSERGRGRGLLSARRGGDVLPHAAGHAPRPKAAPGRGGRPWPARCWCWPSASIPARLMRETQQSVAKPQAADTQSPIPNP